MDQHDDRTEHYLKEFQPRAIRALVVAPRPRNILVSRFAAAAALVVATGGALWFARSGATPLENSNAQRSETSTTTGPRYASIAALTSLALSNTEEFEAVLTERSRESLPNFQGEHSTLKVLAKE